MKNDVGRPKLVGNSADINILDISDIGTDNRVCSNPLKKSRQECFQEASICVSRLFSGTPALRVMYVGNVDISPVKAVEEAALPVKRHSQKPNAVEIGQNLKIAPEAMRG